jgi:hypothetical protein
MRSPSAGGATRTSPTRTTEFGSSSRSSVSTFGGRSGAAPCRKTQTEPNALRTPARVAATRRFGGHTNLLLSGPIYPRSGPSVKPRGTRGARPAAADGKRERPRGRPGRAQANGGPGDAGSSATRVSRRRSYSDAEFANVGRGLESDALEARRSRAGNLGSYGGLPPGREGPGRLSIRARSGSATGSGRK